MDLKKQSGKDIADDGRAFKAERKGKRNTIFIAVIVQVVLETVLLILFCSLKSLEEWRLMVGIIVAVAFFLQACLSLLTYVLFKKVLVLSDYDAGLEYYRRLEEREKKITERDKRSDGL